jgi:hypothetical protein
MVFWGTRPWFRDRFMGGGIGHAPPPPLNSYKKKID